MKEFVKKFLEELDAEKNEHGVYIYKSANGNSVLNLESILENFGQEIKDKINDSLK